MLMKKLTLNLATLFSLLLLLLTGCSKTDVAPQDAGSAKAAQDATLPLTFMVKSYIFLRMPGPVIFGQQAGHTGVGYEVREMRGSTVTKVYTYCGGVEGGSWGPVSAPFVGPGGNNGGWVQYNLDSNAEMLSKMRGMSYSSYKFETSFHSISQSDLTGAANMIRYFPYRGYAFADNNCANAVYQVLEWLRVPGVAWPETNWFPKKQFADTSTGWSGARGL